MLALPGILALHAIGMAFAAGLAAVLDLRILEARAVPLAAFRRFLPVLWAGFGSTPPRACSSWSAIRPRPDQSGLLSEADAHRRRDGPARAHGAPD